jgi:hypothetical protein
MPTGGQSTCYRLRVVASAVLASSQEAVNEVSQTRTISNKNNFKQEQFQTRKAVAITHHLLLYGLIAFQLAPSVLSRTSLYT